MVAPPRASPSGVEDFGNSKSVVSVIDSRAAERTPTRVCARAELITDSRSTPWSWIYCLHGFLRRNDGVES